MKNKYQYIIVVFLISLMSCSYFKEIHSLNGLKVNDIFIVYDSSSLRVPASTINIGIGIYASFLDSLTHKSDTILYSKGFKKGSLSWSNFNIKTFGCSYSNGKVKIYDQDWPLKGNIAIDASVKDSVNKHCYISIPKNFLIKAKIFAQNNFKKAPGNFIKLGIEEMYDNQAIERITKKNEVENYFKKCNILVTGGDYKNGIFKITDDIFKIDFNLSGIIAQPIQEPSLADTLSLQLDYIDNYEYTAYSLNGFDAFTGSSGSNGSDASCYGCSGSDGNYGEHGKDGEDGDKGHDISVNFNVEFDSLLQTNLCTVSIDDLSNGSKKYYLVNPKGGSLKLTAYAGRGGNGGSGGKGGNGGNGGDGETITHESIKTITISDSTGTHTMEEVEKYTTTNPGGNGGRGGDGGIGGNGGRGGDGGRIMVYYSNNSKPYLYCLNIKSYGGSGGLSGSGGSGGSGGNGGNGNPSGSNGSSGTSGSSGWWGSSGHDGEVIFIQTDK